MYYKIKGESQTVTQQSLDKRFDDAQRESDSKHLHLNEDERPLLNYTEFMAQFELQEVERVRGIWIPVKPAK